MSSEAVGSLFFGHDFCDIMLTATDGFFDAGMLLQALKARQRSDASDIKASERAAVQARRKDIGKKLHLSDY